MKKTLLVCLSILGLVVGWTIFMGADFYVIPVKAQFISWDKIIPGSTRFKVVLNGNGVRDGETGLVWEKSPNTSTMDWYEACRHCYQKNVGDRKGWRLPTVEELASLVDQSVAGSPKLPEGNPFTNVQSSLYWSSTTLASHASAAWRVKFDLGYVNDSDKNSEYYVWCVRGGYGHDGY